MVKARVSVTIKWNGEKIKGSIDNAIIQGLNTSALLVERRARIYAPIDTGALKRSIHARKVIKTLKGFEVNIVPTMPYADYVERPGNVRIAGRRPYMEPALMDSLGGIKRIMTAEIKKVMQ